MPPKKEASPVLARPDSDSAMAAQQGGGVPTRKRGRKSTPQRAPESVDTAPTPKAKRVVTRKPKLHFLAPVQETKRVPKRNAAFGDYVLSVPGRPSRWEDEEYEDATGGDGGGGGDSGGGSDSERVADAPQPPHAAARQPPPGRAPPHAHALPGGGGGADDDASRRCTLWQDFSAVVDVAAAEGVVAWEEAAELRRLAYAGADAVLRDIYAVGPSSDADRGAFLARARRALEAAASEARGAAERAAAAHAASNAAVPAAPPAAAAIAAA